MPSLLRRGRFARALALLCALTLVASACGDDDDEDSAEGGDASPTAPAGEDGDDGDGESLLTDDGPCDESLDVYSVGTIHPIESPVLSTRDDVVALEASIEAFNERGGVGGHCIELTVCDSQADPNKELDCVRQLANSDIVATLSGSTPFNPESSTLFEQAGIPRVLLSPVTQGLSSPVTYAIGAGGSGTTFMMVPACTRNGHTQLAAIHVDSPAINPLFAALQPMLDAYGAEIVIRIPVPAGTTDFQQFTLAAEQAGATCAIVPLGENEGVQVLEAAQQLGTELTFAGSTNTFSTADMLAYGDFAENFYLNAAVPPATADEERWPILPEMIADLEASGEAELQADELDTSAVRSWLSVYALRTVIEEFGAPDDITREAVTAAFEAAEDVNMFDLVPAWTPSASLAPDSPFSAVSQPWYYVSTFDADAGEWVVSEDQYHVLSELGGMIEYDQPGAPAEEPSTEETTGG